MALLDTGRLFNTLLSDAFGEEHVANELDAISTMSLPFHVFRATATRDRNGPDLWSVNLTLYLYDDTATAWANANRLDDLVQSWVDGSFTGIVPGVAGIEAMDEEFSALSPVTHAADTSVNGQFISQYIGSYQLAVRALS